MLCGATRIPCNSASSPIRFASSIPPHFLHVRGATRSTARCLMRSRNPCRRLRFSPVSTGHAPVPAHSAKSRRFSGGQRVLQPEQIVLAESPRDADRLARGEPPMAVDRHVHVRPRPSRAAATQASIRSISGRRDRANQLLAREADERIDIELQRVEAGRRHRNAARSRYISGCTARRDPPFRARPPPQPLRLALDKHRPPTFDVVPRVTIAVQRGPTPAPAPREAGMRDSHNASTPDRPARSRCHSPRCRDTPPRPPLRTPCAQSSRARRSNSRGSRPTNSGAISRMAAGQPRREEAFARAVFGGAPIVLLGPNADVGVSRSSPRQRRWTHG